MLTPKLPDGFQQSIFKGQVRDGFPRVCDQLVRNSDGEVTGKGHRCSHYQSLGGYMLMNIR